MTDVLVGSPQYGNVSIDDTYDESGAMSDNPINMLVPPPIASKKRQRPPPSLLTPSNPSIPSKSNPSNPIIQPPPSKKQATIKDRLLQAGNAAVDIYAGYKLVKRPDTGSSKVTELLTDVHDKANDVASRLRSYQRGQVVDAAEEEPLIANGSAEVEGGLAEDFPELMDPASSLFEAPGNPSMLDSLIVGSPEAAAGAEVAEGVGIGAEISVGIGEATAAAAGAGAEVAETVGAVALGLAESPIVAGVAVAGAVVAGGVLIAEGISKGLQALGITKTDVVGNALSKAGSWVGKEAGKIGDALSSANKAIGNFEHSAWSSFKKGITRFHF